MIPLEHVASAIWWRAESVKKLKDAEGAAVQSLPWYRIIERWMQRRRIQILQGDVAEHDPKIGDDGAQRLANTAVDQIWKLAANTIIPSKNPYGRATNGQFDRILEQAWDLRDTTDFEAYSNKVVTWIPNVPEVRELITVQTMRASAQTRINECNKVASDQAMLRLNVIHLGLPATIIQHRASGLRALFMPDGKGFGVVNSTPDSVRSIDPGYTSERQEWSRYLGLGIGGRLYAEANRLLPGVRWVANYADTAYSQQLRKNLHAANPFIWDDKCQWCEDEIIRLGLSSWKETDRTFFINHA